MSQGAWVLLAVVVLASGFGLWRVARDGRFRGTRRIHGADVSRPGGAALEGYDLGERATLLQFSSAFCAPCRATRRILEDVANVVPGVAHIEVDAEGHLELVRRLGILRTPTTLLLDPRGVEVERATGALTKSEVLASLGRVVT